MLAKDAPNSIGIVGGLGVGATMYYYAKLTEEFAARNAQPRLIISHANLGLVFRLMSVNAQNELADYLASHIDGLSRAGARFAAVAAVAPHICAHLLRATIGVPFIDLIECAKTRLEARNAKRVCILGTQYVMQSDLYGRLNGMEVVRPTPKEVQCVHSNYVKIASSGTTAGVDIESIRRIAQRLVRDQGADVVVLAGTELALAFDESDCGFPALDCARAHIDELVTQAFNVTIYDWPN